MKAFFEYLPLVALLSQVAVVAAMNVALRLMGEKGTLLLPGMGGYIGAEMADVSRFLPDRGPEMEDQDAPEVEYRKAA